MPRLALQIPEIRRGNKNTLAEFFEVNLSTVDAWCRKGVPALQKGRQGTPWVFDLRAVAEWLYGNTPGDTGDGEMDPEAMLPKDRKDWYDGEEKRRRLAKEAEELLTAEQYVENQSALLQPVAACLETLPDVLERKCALKPKIVVAIRDALDEYRTEIANRVIQDVSADSA